MSDVKWTPERVEAAHRRLQARETLEAHLAKAEAARLSGAADLGELLDIARRAGLEKICADLLVGILIRKIEFAIEENDGALVLFGVKLPT